MTAPANLFIPYPLGQSAQSSLPGDPTIWIVLGVASMAMAWVTLRPMLRGKKKDPLDRPPQFASLAQQRAVERQMESLLVELEKMARAMNAQLDTRAAKLEQLIHEADAMRAELSKAVAAAKATVANGLVVPSANGAHRPDAEPNVEVPDEVDPRYARIYDLADTGKSAADIAVTLERPKGEVELILALRPKAKV
jgi:hypothetical protein